MPECESEFRLIITYNSDNLSYDEDGLQIERLENEIRNEIHQLISKKFPAVYYIRIEE